MSTIELISLQQKASYNCHKFALLFQPTIMVTGKKMLEPFLITNNLFGYVNESIPWLVASNTTISKGTAGNATTSAIIANPNYTTWIHNDAHHGRRL